MISQLVIWKYWLPLANGLWTTVYLSLLGIALGAAVGLAVCLARLYLAKPVSLIAQCYIQFCRNTPILVQLIWVHYALAPLLNVNWSAETSSVIALTLQTSGYVAEVFRAGIQSLERGQIDAALALGMPSGLMLRRIILPQALRRMLPPLMNQIVTVVKSSSVVSYVAVSDLMYMGTKLSAFLFRPIEVYTTVALIYLALVSAVSYWADAVQRKYPPL
jgi:polar amino acid transport system permease protein